AELEQAHHAVDGVGQTQPVPEAPDSTPLHEARRAAEQARRAASTAASSLAGLRTRREFLEEQASQIEAMALAASEVPQAESEVATAAERSRVAEQAAVALARLRSELDGLEALRPAGGPGLRLGEVIIAEA